MPCFDAPQSKIHYLDCGEGPCIVFVHGSGGNHLSWWQQVPAFSERYRCLVLDLRGFGLSRTPAWPSDAAIYDDDLLALLDHLAIARTHIVGQSVGGHYALRFALRHPDRVHGLVLADTLAGIADERLVAAKKAAGPPPSPLIERALGERFRNESATLTFLYRSIEQINHIDREPLTLLPQEVSAAEVSGLKAPTLFVVGESDPVAPAPAVAIAATMVAGAKLVQIADSGHSPYFEQPALFNQAVLEFLSDLG